MKIILSRKGFDSGTGGFPSPLIPCDTDGNWIKLNSEKTKKWNDINSDWEDCTKNQVIQYKMYSIPIPQEAIDNFTLPYNSLCIQDAQGTKLTDVLNDITGKTIVLEKNVLDYGSSFGKPIHMHLDPDIRECAVPRCPNHTFYPAFGQCKGAEKFLQNQPINKDDIFIFFGLFQEVYWTGTNWALFDKKNKNGIYAQVIWGYMKICDILALQTANHSPATVGNIQDYIHTNVSTHPHMSPRYHKEAYNRIYIGDQNCTGVFEFYDKARDLTCQNKSYNFNEKEKEYVNFWKNQSLIHLFNGATTNGNNTLLKSKNTFDDDYYIYAQGQWQEAVIDLEKIDEKGHNIFDKKSWETYLKTFISSENCCQTNSQDDQNAKN